MAPITTEANQNSNKGINFTSVKSLSDSPDLTQIPPSHKFITNPEDELVTDVDDDDPIPTIDYSLLVSGTPDQRAKTIRDIGKACEQWGFFLLINHVVPENLMEKMVDQVSAFFNLKEEEKQEYVATDPIKYGTSFNIQMDKVFFWRDFLKILVRPEFHSPTKPVGFRETAAEYRKRTWKVGGELLKGISESLGLEANYIERTMELDSGMQMMTGNFYPPCPQPELAMGIPPHADTGLLNVLMQNGVSGLQVFHNHEWINVGSAPNCFLVLVCDYLEIVSNGKYKSVLHRAVVNNKTTRISLGTNIAPTLDTVVEPASELLDSQSNPAAYVGTKHRDYIKLYQSNQDYGKYVINKVKI